jgi:hypothetical protein
MESPSPYRSAHNEAGSGRGPRSTAGVHDPAKLKQIEDLVEALRDRLSGAGQHVSYRQVELGICGQFNKTRFAELGVGYADTVPVSERASTFGHPSLSAYPLYMYDVSHREECAGDGQAAKA